MYIMPSRGVIFLQITMSPSLHFEINEEDKALTTESAKPPEGQL